MTEKNDADQIPKITFGSIVKISELSDENIFIYSYGHAKTDVLMKEFQKN